MSSGSKRKSLSLKTKIELIEFAASQKISIRQLAEKFKVGKTQVSVVLKQKNELKKLWEQNGNLERKRNFYKTEGLRIDTVLFKWFTKARAKNIPISGPILKEKALEIAKELDCATFKASNGWLQKFLIRHNITFKTVSGESANVNPEKVDEWINKLPTIIKDYHPRDVFNADETGLYFRALPSKTFSLKGSKCSGGKPE
jgi:transposase-like protein